jgi:hypothetical protein
MTPDEIKRLRYYEKQYLRTQDFQDEQAYHIEMRRRHSIAHHSWGIVTGLEIQQDPTSKIWTVQVGMAVDGYGREIVVFAPERLDINRIATELSGQVFPAKLKIWIAYKTEKLDLPTSGYRNCDGKDDFTRIQESFRLIYQNNPPIDSPEPKPSQKLSDDPNTARWPLCLGTITWNNNAIESLDPSPRHYVGAVASQLLVPDNKLLIRGKTSPLPTDPNSPKSDYRGVEVTLEGSLIAERDITGQTVHGASWSYQKNIDFTTSVTTAAPTLTEISNYKITIETPKLACTIVTLHIPFTGNDTAGRRSRICLEFDGKIISDASKFNQGQWELHEITLTGLVQNIAAGNHTIRVLASVDGGTLNIPHYNPTLIEAKTIPAIFANFYMVGFY